MQRRACDRVGKIEPDLGRPSNLRSPKASETTARAVSPELNGSTVRSSHWPVRDFVETHRSRLGRWSARLMVRMTSASPVATSPPRVRITWVEKSLLRAASDQRAQPAPRRRCVAGPTRSRHQDGGLDGCLLAAAAGSPPRGRASRDAGLGSLGHGEHLDRDLA